MFPIPALILGRGKVRSKRKPHRPPFRRKSRYLVLVRGDAGGGGGLTAEGAEEKTQGGCQRAPCSKVKSMSKGKLLARSSRRGRMRSNLQHGIS